MQKKKKKSVSGSIVNSQVWILSSNIIGSEYGNGMPWDLFLAEIQPRS